MSHDFHPSLAEIRNYFENQYRDFLDFQYQGHSQISKPMLYALSTGGKRVRALLSLSFAKAVGGSFRQALRAAFSIEMIHCYSLVHDDLPVMDNDQWRRGQYTTHIAYDEATAILVGDALQSDAFLVLSNCDYPHLEPAQNALKLVACLAQASGSRGMVYGQALDLFWTGRADYSYNHLVEVHQHKTGCLIAAACEMGVLSVLDCPQKRKAAVEFGKKIGLAFQIYDDYLDNFAGIGKTAGKDYEAGKLTYLKFYNSDELLETVHQLTREALAVMEENFSKKHLQPIYSLSQWLMRRNH